MDKRDLQRTYAALVDLSATALQFTAQFNPRLLKITKRKALSAEHYIRKIAKQSGVDLPYTGYLSYYATTGEINRAVKV